MLEARGIIFAYKGHKVLDAVHADVERGEVVSVVGPNGAGKSTLIKCIAAIHKPQGGTVRIDGKDPLVLSRREVAKQLAYLPQSLLFRFPVSVFETVLSGRRPYFSWRPSRKDVEKVEQTIEALALSPLATRDMDQLSGGQRQKVLLARALVQDTRYLLLDEPNAGLDLRHQLEILETVAALAREKEMGVLMALHDLNLAARFSHRILMIHRGRIIAEGTPFEVITGERIREVYGVEAQVTRSNGHLNVHVLRCAGEDPQTPADGL